MSKIKTSIWDGLTPGDKVVLRLPKIRELTREGNTYQKKLVSATVVAIYPHCIQFQTEYGYMVTPAIMVAQEMISGVEYHGRCPGYEAVVGRRLHRQVKKGWKVYD